MSIEYDVDVDVRLCVDDVAVDADDISLLEAIEATGSVNAATRSLGRSYAHALRRIETLEGAIGPLTERHRGGPTGGGTTLTDRGRGIVEAFATTDATMDHATDAVDNRLRGLVRGLDGDFARIDTPLGTVRSVAPATTGRVTVAVPATAITIHPHRDQPPADFSSAQNRFVGVVDRIDADDETATVWLGCRGVPLAAALTPASIDRLELAPGDRATAAFKATATRPVGVNTSDASVY